jgi:manganese/zinc/iron transport system permease protein
MTEQSFLSAIIDILTFQAGYNTGVVLVGTTVLGAAAGLIGAIVLLRKRALMSDSISHSTLPGVALAFLIMVGLGGEGRNLPILLLGAAITATLGVLSVQWIKANTRLGEDAAIGTVLSVYYGVGIVLLTIIQGLNVGGQAGLDSFLLGAVASLRAGEAWLIAVASFISILVALAFLKELLMVSFDRGFAAGTGWPVDKIDLLLMGLLLTIVSVGLKTVGMVLIIAIVIIPGAAARFWTNRSDFLLFLSCLIGALSAMIGVAISAIVPDAPTGAVIVLTAGAFFAISMIAGIERGVLFGAVHLGLWRYRVWECQSLLKLTQGEHLPEWRLNWLARCGYADLSGNITRAGRQRAKSIEVAVMGHGAT